jgi:hypothetical protein
MGRKGQEVDFSTQQSLEKLLAKARNLKTDLLEDDGDNVIIVDYLAARGQLQHSTPSDLAQGRLAMGKTLHSHYTT